MKLLVCAVLLVVAVGALAKDDSNKMLLGGDDVDKIHADMEAGKSDDSTDPPSTIREVKKKVKDDKRELKELQDRARTLKEQLRDNKLLSKAEKKALKKQYKGAKSQLHSKKQELHHLKSEIKVLKSGKHDAPPTLSTPTDNKVGKSRNRGGGRKHKKTLELIGAEETKINNPEQMGLQSEPAMNNDGAVLSKKEQKKLMRKMSRKSGRKHNKKGRKEDLEEGPKLRTSLLPRRSHPGKKHRGGKGHKVRCVSDTDCLNGAKCFENRKGHKFCKGNGMDKSAGKKCHRSEQCARGLQCFVTGAHIETGKKHRKQKGICADPQTTDLTKGSFIPLHHTKPAQ